MFSPEDEKQTMRDSGFGEDCSRLLAKRGHVPCRTARQPARGSQFQKNPPARLRNRRGISAERGITNPQNPPALKVVNSSAEAEAQHPRGTKLGFDRANCPLIVL